MTVTQTDLDWYREEYASPLDFMTPAELRAYVMAGARPKVRPAELILITPANAFGDYGHFDANGNPLMQQIDERTGNDRGIVSEMDELTEDWKPYATQTEERLHNRGDDVTYDATSKAWFAAKGDQVELRTERASLQEKQFTSLPGYHKEVDGTIQCWYCATTFNVKWFTLQSDCVQDGETTRSLMEHFAIEALLHSVECHAKYNGLPLLRMIGYDGKPRHQRASLTWGKAK